MLLHMCVLMDDVESEFACVERMRRNKLARTSLSQESQPLVSIAAITSMNETLRKCSPRYQHYTKKMPHHFSRSSIISSIFGLVLGSLCTQHTTIPGNQLLFRFIRVICVSRCWESGNSRTHISQRRTPKL